MAKRSKGSSGQSSWLSSELKGCEFEGEPLGKRFRTLTEQLWDGIGESIPFACQDWANTKAAYRFLSNERVQEAQILAGHFSSTRERFAATNGTVLILQDTTEFSYEREEPDLIGMTSKVYSGRDKKGRVRLHTACGILMHSSLVVTTEGLPPGACSREILESQGVQGNQRAEAYDQSHTRSDRGEGKLPMAGEPATGEHAV